MFYLFEIHNSDGNDNRIHDCIIEAEDKQTATDMLFDDLDELGWESDGDMGYFAPCDCEQPEEPTDDPYLCQTCQVVTIQGYHCHETDCPTDKAYRAAKKAFDRWECQGHGGITVSSIIEEYATEKEAEKACSNYHSRYSI